MKLNSKNLEMSALAGYGLCFILLIAGGLGVEKFAAMESQQERQVIAAQSELATLASIKDTSHWTERFLESKAAREQMQAELWHGVTSGVIAAELQQALLSLARQHKFESIQVRVDPDPIEIDGVQVLSFEFQGRSPSSKVLADYFAGLATNSKIILVDEASFSQNLDSPRPPVFRMAGIVPVQIAQGAGPK